MAVPIDVTTSETIDGCTGRPGNNRLPTTRQIVNVRPVTSGLSADPNNTMIPTATSALNDGASNSTKIIDPAKPQSR